MKQYKALAAHFEAMHKNPPPPFNTAYNPNAKKAHDAAIRFLWSLKWFRTLKRKTRARLIAIEYPRQLAKFN